MEQNGPALHRSRRFLIDVSLRAQREERRAYSIGVGEALGDRIPGFWIPDSVLGSYYLALDLVSRAPYIYVLALSKPLRLF